MIIQVLPIGEFDTASVKNSYEAIITAISRIEPRLVIANPVSNETQARQFVFGLSATKPELLVIIVLRGLSAETIEAAIKDSPSPCLVLPVQGRYALPSSTLAVGAVRESNLPTELLYAPADHPEFLQRLGQVIRAAKAYSKIRTSRIGIVGALFSNLVSCRYDPQILNARLGVTLLPITFDAIRSSIKKVTSNTRAIARFHQQIANSSKVDAADGSALDAGIKLHLALKQIAKQQKLDGYATECWSGFPGDLGLNPCMGFIEDAYALACEGDVMLCISLLIVRHLTAGSAYVGDLFDLDIDGILTLTHCGAPASLSQNKNTVVLGKSQLASQRGFETLTCRPLLDPGPVTVFRFYGLKCDRLHLAAGELISCEQSPNLMVRIRINADRWSFLEQCLGNHYLVVAGDIRSELKLLCKWLGITVFET